MPKKICPECKIVFKTKYIRKTTSGEYTCPNEKCKKPLPKEWFEENLKMLEKEGSYGKR